MQVLHVDKCALRESRHEPGYCTSVLGCISALVGVGHDYKVPLMHVKDNACPILSNQCNVKALAKVVSRHCPSRH